MTRQSQRPARVAPSGGWILDPLRDFVLFVGTPLLIVPLLGLARLRFSAEDIGLAVATFGSQGHHLPGMLRAYGDRNLFRRYRARFVLAPLLLLAVCELFAFTRLDGLMVVVLLWGFWHGLAQVYGFMRIYDAKVGATSRMTSRLDLAICIAWFVGGLLHSSERVAQIMDVFYKSGGPFVPGSVFLGVRNAWDVLTAVTTISFLVHTVVAWRLGQRCSRVKLFIMASAFSFWWYAMVYIRQIILGVALFEICHDIQYLAIVWVYNRARIQKAQGEFGAAIRLVFSKSAVTVWMYVGLVFGYGALGRLDHVITTQTFKLALYGMVSASGLLHFYYDGFIWKIREPATAAPLGVQSRGTGGMSRPTAAAGIHALKWSVLAVAATWLLTSQLSSRTLPLQQAEAVLRLVPESATAQTRMGNALQNAGNVTESIDHYQEALRLDPGIPDAQYSWGNALQTSHRFDEAIGHYREAVQQKPDYAEAQNSWATALHSLGRVEEALPHYQEAAQLKPAYAEAQYNWASALEDLNRTDEAIAHYREAIRLQPDYAEAHYNWGHILQALNGFDEAVLHYQDALRIKPDYAEAHNNWGVALAAQGRLRDAAIHFRQALRLNPDYVEARENLRMTGSQHP